MRRKQPFHLKGGQDVGTPFGGVLLLGVFGDELEAGGDDDTLDSDFDRFGLLEIVYRMGGTNLFARPAEHAVFRVQHRLLRDCGRERHTNGLPRPEIALEFMRQVHGTDVLALTASYTEVFIHISRLLLECRPEERAFPGDGLHLCIGQDFNIGMVGCGSHSWGCDAACTVESREDLAQRYHHSADAWLSLHHGHLESLIRQVQGCSEPANATTHDEGIKLKSLYFHDYSYRCAFEEITLGVRGQGWSLPLRQSRLDFAAGTSPAPEAPISISYSRSGITLLPPLCAEVRSL